MRRGLRCGGGRGCAAGSCRCRRGRWRGLRRHATGCGRAARGGVYPAACRRGAGDDGCGLRSGYAVPQDAGCGPAPDQAPGGGLRRLPGTAFPRQVTRAVARLGTATAARGWTVPDGGGNGAVTCAMSARTAVRRGTGMTARGCTVPAGGGNGAVMRAHCPARAAVRRCSGAVGFGWTVPDGCGVVDTVPAMCAQTARTEVRLPTSSAVRGWTVPDGPCALTVPRIRAHAARAAVRRGSGTARLGWTVPAGPRAFAGRGRPYHPCRSPARDGNRCPGLDSAVAAMRVRRACDVRPCAPGCRAPRDRDGGEALDSARGPVGVSRARDMGGDCPVRRLCPLVNVPAGDWRGCQRRRNHRGGDAAEERPDGPSACDRPAGRDG